MEKSNTNYLPVWVSFSRSSSFFSFFSYIHIYIYGCAIEPRDEPSIMMDRASSFYQSFKRDRASIIEERRSISQRGRRYSLSMGDSLKRSQSWFATIIDHWRRAWRSAWSKSLRRAYARSRTLVRANVFLSLFFSFSFFSLFTWTSKKEKLEKKRKRERERGRKGKEERAIRWKSALFIGESAVGARGVEMLAFR